MVDFDFMNNWKTYIDEKSCPENIIPIINYTFINQSKQLVLNSGLKIISDWTFLHNANLLIENEELLSILQTIIDDSYYIFNLDVVFIIINNLLSDSHSNVKLQNIDNFIPRITFCSKRTIEEWWYMISVYTTYKFDENILEYICKNIIDGIYHNSYIQIIYRQCKLKPYETIAMLSKYNIFNYLENFIDSNQFIHVLKIFNCALKLKTKILFTPYFYQTLYDMNEIYKFLSRMLLHNFEFYKHESVFSIYTDKLVVSKTQITINELLFLTLMYKHFKHIYTQKIAHFLKSRLKNIDTDLLGSVYFNLIRKIYNTDTSFFNKAFINRVLNHHYGFHFCTNLSELSYRNCLINKIKIDKLFNPFL